jgi:murein tripeptide amidase MpaA
VPGLLDDYRFDRFLRYAELVDWTGQLAAAHPDLVAVDTYGRSFEGRDLLLVTVTDSTTGTHDTKPAHWVDASIHAVELTATVAACRSAEAARRRLTGSTRRSPVRCVPGRSTSCRE